jgi:hypothetical protein
MSDRRHDDIALASRDPYRRPAAHHRGAKILGAVVTAFIVAGLIGYAISSNLPRTAMNPAPETTGRSAAAPVPPVAPLPGNPTETTPRALPTVPPAQ